MLMAGNLRMSGPTEIRRMPGSVKMSLYRRVSLTVPNTFEIVLLIALLDDP